MVIERGASNTIAVMARETLSPSYWLLHFNDPDRNGNAYCIVQAGNNSGSIITLTFTEVASGAVATSGQVTLSPAGNWQVTIYEQTSPTNLDVAQAQRNVGTVAIYVDAGAAQDTGWTDECPAVYPPSPGCDEITLTIAGVDVPVEADECEVDVQCTDLSAAAYVTSEEHTHGGLYVPTGNQTGGKPDYVKVDDATRIIYYDSGRWVLDNIGDHTHEANAGDEDFPWQATWTDIIVAQAQVSQLCNGAETTRGTFIVGVSQPTTVNTYACAPARMVFIDRTQWDKVSMGSTHMVAIRNGRLYVAGDATNGATGQGSTAGSYTPLTRIGSDSDWTDCAAGIGCSYAIRDGRIYVTGLNNVGQLGDGTTTTKTVFTQVGSDTDWEKVSASQSGAGAWAAAIKGGALLTCGSNLFYQTGLNTNVGNTTSWSKAMDGPLQELSAGAQHGLAIGAGVMYSWGTNINGRTGQNTQSGSTQIPTQVGVDSDWAKVAAGGTHSLAIKDTGSLWGFGQNTNGRLGTGDTTTQQVPTQEASGAFNWAHVSLPPTSAATATHASYAIKTDGSVWGAGPDQYGQIMQSGALNNTEFGQMGIATNHTLIAAGIGYVITVRT